MVVANCKMCGETVKRGGSIPGVFCSRACKSDWQREQKPVTREWLEQKYVVEGLSSYAIAKLVKRNPKRVYEWLRDYAIPIRERFWDTEAVQVFHSKEWLTAEYVERGRSLEGIAQEFGVTGETISYHMKRHGIARRTTSEVRQAKYWGPVGAANPMYGRSKEQCSQWKGGVTPERQALYSSREWIQVEAEVWLRDGAKCVRCGAIPEEGVELHVHHIASFEHYKDLRTDPNNLALLCCKCHGFVHSRANTGSEFIVGQKGGEDNGTILAA